MKALLPLMLLLFVLFPSAQTHYAVLNSFGETISIGEIGFAPENDVITTGSIPNEVFPGFPGLLYTVCSGNSVIQRLSMTCDGASIDGEFLLPAGSNPYLMYYDGEQIYTSLWVHGGIAIINESSDSIIVIDPFCLGPQGIFADDNYIYVSAGNLDPITFEYGDGILYRLTHGGEIVDSIVIGTNPQQIISGPDGNLHIVCTGNYVSIEGMAYILDIAGFTVVDSVRLGGSPQRLALDKTTGLVYSGTSVWGTAGSGRILCYDGNTHEVLYYADDTENAIAGTGIIGISANDGMLFIPSMDSSWIEIIEHDGESLSITGRYNTGYGPLDVALYSLTGIDENARPEKLDIVTAYPNPFNSGCRIAITGANTSEYIIIFDGTGRCVHTIDAATARDYIWHPDKSVSGGMYYVRAIVDGKLFGGTISYIK